jgi:hypothetical protein
MGLFDDLRDEVSDVRRIIKDGRRGIDDVFRTIEVDPADRAEDRTDHEAGAEENRVDRTQSTIEKERLERQLEQERQTQPIGNYELDEVQRGTYDRGGYDPRSRGDQRTPEVRVETEYPGASGRTREDEQRYSQTDRARINGDLVGQEIITGWEAAGRNAGELAGFGRAMEDLTGVQVIFPADEQGKVDINLTRLGDAIEEYVASGQTDVTLRQLEQGWSYNELANDVERSYKQRFGDVDGRSQEQPTRSQENPSVTVPTEEPDASTGQKSVETSEPPATDGLDGKFTMQELTNVMEGMLENGVLSRQDIMEMGKNLEKITQESLREDPGKIAEVLNNEVPPEQLAELEAGNPAAWRQLRDGLEQRAEQGVMLDGASNPSRSDDVVVAGTPDGLNGTAQGQNDPASKPDQPDQIEPDGRSGDPFTDRIMSDSAALSTARQLRDLHMAKDMVEKYGDQYHHQDYIDGNSEFINEFEEKYGVSVWDVDPRAMQNAIFDGKAQTTEQAIAVTQAQAQSQAQESPEQPRDPQAQAVNGTLGIDDSISYNLSGVTVDDVAVSQDVLDLVAPATPDARQQQTPSQSR